MYELIFHKDFEYKLINFQKYIVSELNKDGFKVLRNYRLHPIFENFITEIPNNLKDLKNLTKKIEKLHLKKFIFKDNCLLLPVELSLDGKKILTNLKICTFFNLKQDEKEKLAILERKCPLELPMDISIFRLAKSIKPTENSMAVEFSVWVKLHYN